jgi:hypothetical protein
VARGQDVAVAENRAATAKAVLLVLDHNLPRHVRDLLVGAAHDGVVPRARGTGARNDARSFAEQEGNQKVTRIHIHSPFVLVGGAPSPEGPAPEQSLSASSLRTRTPLGFMGLFPDLW